MEQLEAAELERAAKRPRHEDLGIETLIDEEPSTLNSLRTRLETVCRETHPRSVGKEAEDAPEDDNFEELKEKLSSMVIRSRAKVTQDRVYSMAYHPEPTKDLVFVGWYLPRSPSRTQQLIHL